jgi:hypothetical protein
MFKSDHKHSSYGGKSIFFKEGPDPGQDPEILGYGLKTPDRPIDVLIPTKHRAL